MLTRTGVRLAEWTTLRIGGPAPSFVEASARSDLYDAVAAADDAGEEVLVLGGGSNLVVGDDGFAGRVVHVASTGITVAGDACSGVEVVAEAGEDWDGLVAHAVASEWIGVEALSGIPGTVGAVPIQNVGAYGQDVAETIAQVHVFDRLDRRPRTMFAADCAFGYRSSVFKRNPGRYVVGAVTFQFRPGSRGTPVQYAELAKTLGIAIGERALSSEVRQAVLGLRRTKGMVLDRADHDTWSAGSFFTNPLLAPDRLPEGAPSYPQPDGTIKTSAAWLIERAGFTKGYGNDRVRLSSKHSLALTNRGAACAEDVLSLAREIRGGVESTFGIGLDPEPVRVNCDL
ncbi:MAG: UDP-N-acetylmuramate dehydrogenase [Nocardioidaceae bacterium]|nr:UDP-N-acetylmuramate dehydrogenase [Nocardioidaceae bacterium]